jgi:hypothetical protein
VAIFLAALVAAEAIVRPGDTWTPGRAIAALGRLAAIGTTGLILISPWIARLWEAHLQQLRIPADVSAPIDFPVGLATSGDDRWVAILGLLGLALALARGRRVATLCAVWFGLVFLAANPASFHLPYSLTLDNGALAIAAFLPAAVFAGDLGATAPRLAPGVAWPRATPWVASVAILLLGLSQAPHLVGIVNPVCILFRLGDRGAMRWAAANTPPDSRFLVNGFVWAPGHYMGTDAGYWLPVLAGRRTTLPLLFYRVGPSDEVRAVNDLAARVEAAASNPAEIARLSAQEGARYVFIGTRGGDLDPGTLVASGRFRVVYGAEGAWILELVEGASTRSATSIGVTPTGVGTPREANAAGLRSSTSG